MLKNVITKFPLKSHQPKSYDQVADVRNRKYFGMLNRTHSYELEKC